MSHGVFVCCFIAGFLRTFKMLMCTVSFLKGNMKDGISPVWLPLESFSSRITPGISIPQNTLWETGFHCVDASESSVPCPPRPRGLRKHNGVCVSVGHCLSHGSFCCVGWVLGQGC